MNKLYKAVTIERDTNKQIEYFVVAKDMWAARDLVLEQKPENQRLRQIQPVSTNFIMEGQELNYKGYLYV